MRKMYVKGRKIVVQTTNVLGVDGVKYEVVGNITYSRTNPKILLCSVGDERYIIVKSALQALLYRRVGKSTVSIFKTLGYKRKDKGEKVASKKTKTKRKG